MEGRESVSRIGTYRALSQRVHLHETETHSRVILKMLQCKLPLLEHLLGEGPLYVHHQLQHLVVGPAREQDSASEELIDDAADAPDIHWMICTSLLVDARSSKTIASVRAFFQTRQRNPCLPPVH